MTEYLNIKRTAEILNCTERSVRRLCDRGKLAGARKIGKRWEIPPTAHPKLYQAVIEREITGIDDLAGIAAGKKEEALKKLGLIKSFQGFAANYLRGGGKRTDAVKIFCEQNNISWQSFMRWLKKYREQGLLGLVDTRGGGKFFKDIISPEAFELFKSMYLTAQQLSLKVCWQNICYINKEQNKGWKIPSLTYLYQYISKNIPLYVRVLHREGLQAYQAKCAPYIEIDPDSIQPGQVWVGDHHQLNCWIRYRNRWVRPWITTWQDMRSRHIVGFHISANPNQTTILLAMKRAIEKYGPPDQVRVDNGRDYDSEMWTGKTKARRKALRKGYIDEMMVAGIYGMMDIAVSFAIPYHPQSKLIERWFDTLDRQFTKTIKTYCGKDAARKPEELNQLLESEQIIRQAYTIESFAKVIGRYIEAYNNTAHSGRGMEGTSPADVLAKRASVRVLGEGVLDLLMRVWSGELVVGKNGVKFKGMWYGQYDSTLLAYQGRKVRAAYDPDDLRKLYIYDANTLKLVTIAEQARLIQFGNSVSEENLRFAMRQKAKAVRTAKQFFNSRLAANMELTELTIRAMQDAAQTKEDEQLETLRPVRTPLDNQVAEHKRQQILKEVRKAAGAENIKKVLDIDFGALNKTSKYEGVKLFDE